MSEAQEQTKFTVKLEGVIDNNGTSREAIEDHLRREMMNAIGNGLITGYSAAEVDSYNLDVIVSDH